MYIIHRYVYYIQRNENSYTYEEKIYFCTIEEIFDFLADDYNIIISRYMSLQLL